MKKNQQPLDILAWPFFNLVAMLVPPVHLSAFNPFFLSHADLLTALPPLLFLQLVLFIISKRIFGKFKRSSVVCFVFTISFWALAFGQLIASFLLVLLSLLIGFFATLIQLEKATRYLNIMSFSLVFFASVNVVLNSLSSSDLDKDLCENGGLFPSLNHLKVDTDRLPSISHLVVDGYGYGPTLRNYYGFDNSDFEDYLRDLGFVVFENAISPYPQTLLVMSSVFQGCYIKPQTDLNDFRLRKLLGLSVTQGPLAVFLKARGANFYVSSSGYHFFPISPESVPSDERGVAHRIGALLYAAVELINPYHLSSNPIIRLARAIASGNEEESLGALTYSDSALDQSLTDYSHYRHTGPFFLYNHFLAPHPPFTIDRNGKATNRWPSFRSLADGHHATDMREDLISSYREGYTEKLMYLNSRLRPRLADMIATIPSPKVIILHGDHGPGSLLHHNKYEETCVNERFRPLLAIFTDNEELKRELQKLSSPEAAGFNLVNIYRVIFRYALNAPIDLLPSKSFFVPWGDLRQRTLLDLGSAQALCN